MIMPDHAPVFIAANVEEADFVERLLEGEEIEYEVRPETFVKKTSGVCFQGLLFEVNAGRAVYCRQLLKDRGLERGVVDEEVDDEDLPRP